jgi:hypothetical protein
VGHSPSFPVLDECDKVKTSQFLKSQPPTPSGFAEIGKFFSRSHDAVIRVYDAAGNVIETREHKGEFKEW